MVAAAGDLPAVLTAPVTALDGAGTPVRQLAVDLPHPRFPVVVWGAYSFHKAAVTNARHGAATMDTLISVGVTAAYLWSLWALLFTPAA